MTPSTDKMLMASFGRIIGEVVPRLEGDYLQGTTSTIGMLMMFAATEYGRAADVRAAENVGMRKVFARAARVLPDSDLKARCSAAGKSKDASLMMAALDESNFALRRLLIELQTFVETRTETWAKSLDRAIWQVLKTSAERRFFYLPPM